jgi:MscS family membrane protein
LFTVAAVVWVALLLNGYGERYILRRFRNSSLVELASLVRLARRFADGLVIVASGLAVIRLFGGDPTTALAGLGIGGIAVALAAQKTLENVIGGLSLIFDRALRVGDFLKFGDAFGTVDSVGLRSTRIRTLDRTILTVPNGQIANVSIETLSARDQFWFHHFVGLRYETTPDQIRTVVDGIRALLIGHRAVDVDSARVRFLRFGSSSLDIEIFAYLVAKDWVEFLEIQEGLLLAIIQVVEDADTALALPSQTLHLINRRPVPAAVLAPPASRRSARLQSIESV